MRLRTFKVRKFGPGEIRTDWDLIKIDFARLEQKIFEEQFGFGRGDIVRVSATGWLAEVIEIQDVVTVKLRRLDGGGVCIKNPEFCDKVSGLEALGMQAD